MGLLDIFRIGSIKQENEEFRTLEENYSRLLEEYQECTQQLQLSAPELNAEVNICADETVTE